MTTGREVLGFPEYRAPALRLAQALGCAYREVGIHRFPDGESRVTVPDSPASHTILCRSLADPNDKLIELMLAAETLRDLGSHRVTLVAPYLCYMRQDTAFSPGEAISQRIVGSFLARCVDELITVDPHLHRVDRLEQAVPARRALALSAAEPMAAYLRSRDERALLVGPDTESEQWVRRIAHSAGLDYVIAAKRRAGDRDVAVELPAGEYRQRDAVIIDDMASTGRTLAAAAQALEAKGVRQARALVTHAVFADTAEQLLRDSPLVEVWSTDSIIHETNAIPLAPLLAHAIDPST